MLHDLAGQAGKRDRSVFRESIFGPFLYSAVTIALYSSRPRCSGNKI